MKTTDELVNEIKETTDIEQYLKENENVLINKKLRYFLADMLDGRDKSRTDVIERGGLTEYAHQIFNGRRCPNRDKIIRIAIGLELSLDETQKLMRISETGELYSRDKRDSVIMFSIDKGLSGIETDLLLDRLGFCTLA